MQKYQDAAHLQTICPRLRKPGNTKRTLTYSQLTLAT